MVPIGTQRYNAEALSFPENVWKDSRQANCNTQLRIRDSHWSMIYSSTSPQRRQGECFIKVELVFSPTGVGKTAQGLQITRLSWLCSLKLGGNSKKHSVLQQDLWVLVLKLFKWLLLFKTVSNVCQCWDVNFLKSFFVVVYLWGRRETRVATVPISKWSSCPSASSAFLDSDPLVYGLILKT